jgi:hypothetical protein
MSKEHRWFVAIFVVCLMGTLAGAVSAQTSQASTTTMTETKKFEILSVNGNVLVVRGPDGTREVTVPAGFKFTVDGKQLSVSELKAGMAGTATVTTTVTTRPVVVTEVRNARVMQAYGNSIVLRTQDGGFRLFTSEDAAKYKIKIVRDGKEIEFQQIRAQDNLTAIIVTEKPAEVLTEQQVNARLASMGAAPSPAAAPAKPAAAAPPPPPPPPPPAPAAAAPPKTLPKTASPLPLVGLLGGMSLAIGAALTAIRRRRSAR